MDLQQDIYSITDSKEFTLLHDISNILSSSLNLQQSVAKIFELLHQKSKLNKAFLLSKNNLTQELKIKVSYGISPEENHSKNFNLWKKVNNKVTEINKPIIVTNLSCDTDLKEEILPTQICADSFICFPLILGNEKFGTISVNIRSITEEELFQFSKLMSIVSLMIAQEVRLKRLLDLEKSHLRNENEKLRVELKEKYKITNMIGKSSSMIDVFQNIAQVSKSNTSIFIRGESGTGKELVAHAIHYSSSRSQGPFIKINCGALPESLIESELFGYEKGAFTDANISKIGKFEAANNGTIFLDEISELPVHLQVKLLRVIQEKEIEKIGGITTTKVDVRIITATNKDLELEVKNGNFREDLYYRLNVFPIFIPPLRDRKTDILLISEHFLEKYNKENNKKIKRIASSAINMLYSYHWPGNVRELENCIERATILCNSDAIQPSHLPPSLNTIDNTIFKKEKLESSLKALVDEFERKIIIDELQNSKGKVILAAKSLKTTSRILSYKIKHLNIDLKQIKSNRK